ncbi:SUMF1/EgtB/PvdO family nonheme iron enzyme [Streptomyces sp. NPDC002787]
MERRQLEYFIAVVEHGGFTAAAMALHVAQPSLSHAIRSLERECGGRLFHRLPHGVALTAAGEALVRPARQVLRDLSTAVEGADWRRPDGPHPTWRDRADHPVVHVDWDDARAYCAWAGTRLPTEAEWERAARGGLHAKVFPWGDEFEPGGRPRMNVWQGEFPNRHPTADGWYGTCPVDAYDPNGFGLYNVTGNVWEWCEDPFAPSVGSEQRVTKGGSYLCHASCCRRYRVAARQGLLPDPATGNVGFRCALDMT